MMPTPSNNPTSKPASKPVANPADTGKKATGSVVPAYECLMAEDMFETGMGSVWICKTLPGGKVSAGIFLLDVFCLGVKNAIWWKNAPRTEYDATRNMNLGQTLVPIKPCYAKKLIIEAVSYAENLGLKPHRDYKRAKFVLSGIDANECTTEFEFGCNGRPYYVPGPEETSQKQELIIKKLRKSCGEDGFDTVPIDDLADDMDDFLDDDLPEYTTVTIDDPEQVERLMNGLEAILPFKAEDGNT